MPPLPLLMPSRPMTLLPPGRCRYDRAAVTTTNVSAAVVAAVAGAGLAILATAASAAAFAAVSAFAAAAAAAIAKVGAAAAVAVPCARTPMCVGCDRHAMSSGGSKGWRPPIHAFVSE